jgi:uncharacterized membrane protein
MVGRTYSTFNIIGVTIGTFQTYVAGINDEGNMAGWYWDSSQVEHGFVDTPSGRLTIDYPGAGGTGASGLNNLGQVVGGYTVPESACTPTVTCIYGFLYGGTGQLSTINCPANACPGLFNSAATGINDAGWIVGVWGTNNGFDAGYYYNGAKFQSITVSGALYTDANAINGDGQIVGEWADPSGAIHGFIFYNGVIQEQIDYPVGVGSILKYTYLCGINNNGQILGSYYDQSTQSFPNFLYDESTGTFTPILNNPAGYLTLGLNDLTQIAGAGFMLHRLGPPHQTLSQDRSPHAIRHQNGPTSLGFRS